MPTGLLQKKYEECIARIAERANRARQEAADELIAQVPHVVGVAVAPIAKDMMQDLFDSAVEIWYSSWQGKMYSRTNSLNSVLRFDDYKNDGNLTWGYYDDGLWHDSILQPDLEYNIYDMAFVRGSHGNPLYRYSFMPKTTESPLSLIQAGKPEIEEEISAMAADITKDFFEKNFAKTFASKFSL